MVGDSMQLKYIQFDQVREKKILLSSLIIILNFLNKKGSNNVRGLLSHETL